MPMCTRMSVSFRVPHSPESEYRTKLAARKWIARGFPLDTVVEERMIPSHPVLGRRVCRPLVCKEPDAYFAPCFKRYGSWSSFRPVSLDRARCMLMNVFLERTFFLKLMWTFGQDVTRAGVANSNSSFDAAAEERAKRLKGAASDSRAFELAMLLMTSAVSRNTAGKIVRTLAVDIGSFL